MRSPPISRVLLRRAESARYDRHSSRPAVAGGLEPPTRGLGEQRRRPPIWRCSGWRLPRFTRVQKGSDSSLWPCSSPSPRPRGPGCCGRALPGILLCGARTFLSLELGNPRQRRSGRLREVIVPCGRTGCGRRFGVVGRSVRAAFIGLTARLTRPRARFSSARPDLPAAARSRRPRKGARPGPVTSRGRA